MSLEMVLLDPMGLNDRSLSKMIIFVLRDIKQPV